MLRALAGLAGDEIADGLDLDAEYIPPHIRDPSLCWNCEGRQFVFPGLPGKPMILDTSRILKCPTCGGTGKRPPQLRLPFP